MLNIITVVLFMLDHLYALSLTLHTPGPGHFCVSVLAKDLFLMLF